MSKGWCEWGYPRRHPYISVAWEEGDERDLDYWHCGLCGVEDYELDAGERDRAIVSHLRSEQHMQILSSVHPFPRKGWVVVWDCRTFKKARKRARRRKYPICASLSEAMAEVQWLSYTYYREEYKIKVFYRSTS